MCLCGLRHAVGEFAAVIRIVCSSSVSGSISSDRSGLGQFTEEMAERYRQGSQSTIGRFTRPLMRSLAADLLSS